MNASVLAPGHGRSELRDGIFHLADVIAVVRQLTGRINDLPDTAVNLVLLPSRKQGAYKAEQEQEQHQAEPDHGQLAAEKPLQHHSARRYDADAVGKRFLLLRLLCPGRFV